MSLTNTHELFVSGTHQVPAGRSDIIPPAWCGLSSLLFPIQRAQKVSLARRHNHNTFTESFCWFATDALLHSPFVLSSATNRNTSTATCIRSPFSCHYSQLTTGPQVRRNTLEQTPTSQLLPDQSIKTPTPITWYATLLSRGGETCRTPPLYHLTCLRQLILQKRFCVTSLTLLFCVGTSSAHRHHNSTISKSRLKVWSTLC